MSLYHWPDLYDLQYRRYRDDIPHYLRLAADHGGPILELGAGTGRLSVELAKAGHEVVGLEVSDEMLGQAQQHATREGVAGRLTLVAGDMREFDLGRRFPLVLAAFNTLMHLHTVADQDRTFSCIARHLEEGGAFAFDLFTPRFGAQGVLRREAEWSEAGGEQTELLLVQEHDEITQTITSRYLLDTVREDGLLQRRTATLRQRYYNRFELQRAIGQAGFSRLRLSGGFDGSPLQADSKHLVGLARL